MAGDSFAFDVLVSGSSPFTYQWRKTPPNGSEGPVVGGTNLVLSLTNLVAADAGQYRVVISNSFGSVTSAPAGLSVSDPFIRVQPQGGSVGASTNAFVLSVEAHGTPPLLYQWRTNGVAVPGATNAALILPGLTRGREASYSVVVSNTAGTATSAAAALTVRDPVLLSQPAARTNAEGDTVQFSATAVGTGPLGYQWFHQGSPIPDATNRMPVFTNNNVEQSASSLILSNVTPAQQGSYTVVVTNRVGTLTSTGATLTVHSLAILRQPTNASVVASSNFFNRVEAAGTQPLTYQWYFQPAATSQTNAVAGANSNLLVLTQVTGAQRGSYWVRISNSKGITNSDRATLSVTDPFIVGQPRGGAVGTGDDFTFDVAAHSPPLAYQWLRNGVLLPGATNVSLQLTNVTPSQAGDYSVIVSNTFGQTTSVSARLTVEDLVILSQPQSGWRAAGETYEFRVSARGTRPLAYQWFFEGAPLAGQSASNLVLNSLISSNVGAYWVNVSNAAGQMVRSAKATLMVFDPVIRRQPTGGTPPPGTNVTLLVEAGGTPPFGFQWFFEGMPLGSPIQNAGATNVLTLTNVGPAQSGTYWVQVTNAAGSTLSAHARVSVVDPFIIDPPRHAEIDAGDSFTNSVNAVGTPTLVYQWFFKGNALQGATNELLVLSNLTASQSGGYFVDVSNPVGTQRSASATLTVQDPAIREHPRGATATPGEDYTLRVTATGTQPMTYQWFFNGAALVGKVGPSLALTDLLGSQAGQYSVEVRNAAGARMSSNAIVRLSVAPRTVYNGFFRTSATDVAECAIVFQGNGTENALAFSVSYDPAALTNPRFALATNDPISTATFTTQLATAPSSIGVTVQMPPGTVLPAYTPQPIGLLTFDVVAGARPWDGRIQFTNVPVKLASTNFNGKPLGLRSSLVPAMAFLDAEPQFDAQSGLFVQQFVLSNPTALDSTNAVIYIGGLGEDSLSNPVTFFNAHTGDYLSDPDQDGVVDTLTRAAQLALARGEFLPVTLEFYVSDRTTIPEFEYYGTYFGDLGLLPPSGGAAVPIRSARTVGNKFLVEFLTQSGSTYYIKYADSLQALNDPARLKTAFPSVIGTGSYVQWIDNGPPKTATPPGAGMRFYQVIKSP